MIKENPWKRRRVLTSQRGSREEVSLQARECHIQVDGFECLLQRGDFRAPAVARDGDQ